MSIWVWKFYDRSSTEIHEWVGKLSMFVGKVTVVGIHEVPDDKYADAHLSHEVGDAVKENAMALKMYRDFYDPKGRMKKPPGAKVGEGGSSVLTDELGGIHPVPADHVLHGLMGKLPKQGDMSKHQWYAELIKLVGPEAAGKFVASYNAAKTVALLKQLGGGGPSMLMLGKKPKP